MTVTVRCMLMMMGIASCGPSGALTDSGTSGTPGDGRSGDGASVIDGAASPAIACNAGEAMCVGDQLGSCTLSGHDAVLLQDCRAAGTTTNPARCTTTGCPGGARACCLRADVPCAYTISSPTTDNSGYSSCSAPTMTLNTSCGTFFFSAQGTPSAAPNVCSSDSFFTYAYIDRTKHVAGTTFALTATDTLYFSQVVMGVSHSCSTWTGTVHWMSDVPAWQVDVDLTCSSDTSLHVVATFHGTL